MEDHDGSYRQLFSSPAMVKDLLSGFIHEDWVSELDFEVMEPAPESLKRYQPHFRYFLLDESRLTGAELPLSNLVSALVALENSQSPEALSRALSDLIVWLSQDTQEHRRLRRTFNVWLGRSLLPSRFPGVDLPQLQDLSEVKHMLSERVTEWTQQWKQQGLEQGLKKGRQEGIKKGIEESSLATAQRMLQEGLAVDLIARVTGLSESKISTLR